MASSATTILGLRKQGTGDNEDTWGTELNDDALDLIDEAHGVESIALTGNKTLTSTDYATNEARKAALRLTDGGLSAAPTITVPAVEKTYVVHNTTTYVVTFSSGGTDATVPAQRWGLVYCDGTDVYAQKLFQTEDQASVGGAYEYAFSTTTTDADPGAGVLRLDNATPGSATGIYISDSEANGGDIAALMLTWDDSASTVKGYIKIQSKATPATFYVYSVSALTDNSGYMDFTISPLAGTGTLADNEEIVLSFFRTGDKGETGATGATGTITAAGDGTAAAPGVAWASDTDTGFYRSASGETSYSANNSQILAMNANGIDLKSNGLIGVASVAGDVIATQAEAEAGTNNTELMTPLRTAQAITALASSGMNFQSAASPSGVAAVDFSVGSSVVHVFELSDVVPVSDSAEFQFLTSTDGGSNFDTTSGDYAFTTIFTDTGGSTVTSSNSSSAAFIRLGALIGSDTNEYGVTGTIKMFRPSQSTYTRIVGDFSYELASGEFRQTSVRGWRLSAADVDAVRFVFDSGNIESGYIAYFTEDAS